MRADEEDLELYNSYCRQLLASGPLAEMAHWVSSGQAPSAESLRARGLTSESRGDADRLERFNLQTSRRAFTHEWGFSIPCAETVAALRRLGPLVDLGAGTAYWTALLRAAGHDVVATDAGASGVAIYGFRIGRHAPVQTMTAQEAVALFPDRDVFCSWPTEDAVWPLEAFRALAPARAVALIGGGKTGTPELFRYLAEDFDLVDQVAIPQFPGCDDRLTVHRKRR